MDDQQAPNQVLLACCQDNPAPAPVVDGWNRLTRFPEAAQSQWWELLQPALFDNDEFQDGQRIGAFAERHGLEEVDVLAALQATAFLVTQASALDLTAETFGQDLEALSRKDTTTAALIIERYDEVRRILRKLLVEQSIFDHGKVLVGLDWRVDQLTASNRGVNLETSVIQMTLRYRDGEATERLTLQVTPATMDLLKEFVHRFGS